MKLTVFQSDKGDCLLLTSADGKNVLIDGGMSDSYTTHVAPALNKLHVDKQVLTWFTYRTSTRTISPVCSRWPTI